MEQFKIWDFVWAVYQVGHQIRHLVHWNTAIRHCLLYMYIAALLNVLLPDLKFASPVVVFFCRHTFHEDCLPAHAAASCDFLYIKIV